jgi:type III pantothenate kinase
MKLLLDVGNSRLKWAWLSAQRLVRSGHALHRNHDLAAALREVLLGAPTPDEVRVANVAGPVARALVADVIFESFGIPPVFARSRAMANGLRNGYRDPDQLGVDRWLAMCAAWQKFPGPLCVVDAGTAVTVDIVASDGLHAGGLIVPGAALMVASLRQETGDLDRAAGRGARQEALAIPIEDRHSLGLDTASGIRLGVIRALAAFVADCLASPDMAPVQAKLVITGGDGALIARLLDRPAVHVPELVLHGLALDPVCYTVA